MINLNKLKKIPVTIVPIILSIFYFASLFFYKMSSQTEQSLISVLSYLLFLCFIVDAIRFIIFILLKLKVPIKIITIFATGFATPYLIVIAINYYIGSRHDFLIFMLDAIPTYLFFGLATAIILFAFSIFDRRILNKWFVVSFVLYSLMVCSYIYGIANIIFVVFSLVLEIVIVQILGWLKRFNLNKYLYIIIACIIIGLAVSIIIFSAYIIIILQMNVAANMFTQEIINRSGGSVDWSKLIK